MAFRIPDRQRDAVAKLVRLSDEAMDRLVAALREARPTLSPETLASQLVDRVQLSIEDATQLVAVIGSLLLTMDREEYPKERFADIVARSIAQEHIGELQLDSPAQSKLKMRLEQLLSIEPAAVAAKAADVLYESPVLFASARIISDIRPIFLSSDKLRPAGAVILHTLVIDTSEDTETQGLYIAMDSTDLRSLRATIDRAIEKDIALREVVEKAELLLVDVDSEIHAEELE